MQTKVSVIIPVYNAEKKIDKAISSILQQTMNIEEIEVLFVDDCSTDQSKEIINDYCLQYENFKLIELMENSGGPSKPRNIGVNAAISPYILFLDSDDMLTENACNLLYMEIENEKVDIVRGYIEVEKNFALEYYNRLDTVDYQGVKKIELIRNLIKKQSTTIDGIFRKDFLLENKLFFSENIKMGEDTLFFSECYSFANKISYLDECVYKYVKRNDTNNSSSTQRYGDNELRDHLFVWNQAQKNLVKIKVDYWSLRFQTGFFNMLKSLVHYSNGNITNLVFNELRKFVLDKKKYINIDHLEERLKVIYLSIIENEYDNFIRNTKKRLLINGYDLKFIKPLIPLLEDKYIVKVDEWIGHNRHDENHSKELLDWADIVFCEWLLGNSVWYAQHKRKDQLLFVRMHRFEMTREFIDLIEADKIDAFIAVGFYYYEELCNHNNVPRDKVRLIPNYLDIVNLTQEKEENSEYKIALIGGVPLRKRLDRAVDLLERLLKFDNRYELHVLGNRPEDVDWIWKNSTEREYFNDLQRKISESAELSKGIKFVGWQDTAVYLRKIGYVISSSDDESFHLAPAEGMASNAIGFLINWPGVEYIYPKEFIFENIDQMAMKIRDIQLEDTRQKYIDLGRAFVESAFSKEHVAKSIHNLIAEIYLMK